MMKNNSGATLGVRRRARKMATILSACVALASVGTLALGAAQAEAAYQGPFCNNVFLWENEVCNSNNFSHSRRVTGNSHTSFTWVALYGTSCSGGSKCRSAECKSSGCTADTGYYGSYGSGCGGTCSAQIQNNLSGKGDHYFGHIYE
jgi:hypothetical protein